MIDMPASIQMRDVSDERVTLTRLEPHEARETLGFFMAMDGSEQEQTTQLRSKTKDFANSLRISPLSRSEVWLAWKTSLERTLVYPMVAATLSKGQWNQVMNPLLNLLKVMLPRLGVNCNFPRELVKTSWG